MPTTPTSLESARATLDANTRARRAIEQEPSALGVLLLSRVRRTRPYAARVGFAALGVVLSHPRAALLGSALLLAAIF